MDFSKFSFDKDKLIARSMMHTFTPRKKYPRTFFDPENFEAYEKIIRKDEASDPFHVKTSVLLAQNICILRILKINKY